MHTLVTQQCISCARDILFCLLYLTFRHNTVHPLFALPCTGGQAAGIAIGVIVFVGLVIAAIRVAVGAVLVQRRKYKGRLCK